MTTKDEAERIATDLDAEMFDTVLRGVLNHNAAALIRSQAQEIEQLRAALEKLEKTDWTEVMREGQLVTWGDAATLGYRVLEAVRAALKETGHD